MASAGWNAFTSFARILVFYIHFFIDSAVDSFHLFDYYRRFTLRA